jgi:hypothetical protein
MGPSAFRSETIRFVVAVAEELSVAEKKAKGRPTVEVCALGSNPKGAN